tara:strand:+ start:12 stop:497 length:486 start_codon:yes stop_codon:yes gene_type:complete
MHSKENNKYKIITQGLRPFSSSIPKTLKKYLKKGGYNYSNIVDNWTTIVNKKISDSCYPISIKMRKEMKNGTLMLNVIHGKELEIEYAKNDIIEKINSFFGYNCISQINLKIIEEKIKFKKNKLPIIKNLSKINNKIANVQNPELKESLKKFLKAFDERKN